MVHIAIISSSIRERRNSHRVALFFRDYIVQNDLATAEILDLFAYDFPLFKERMKHMEFQSGEVISFAEKIKSADGIIIVTPEYNGGYPASLKNIIDLLYDEWRRKPIAISAVSDGPFGGTQVVTSLQFTLWKIGALTVPAAFHVTRVQETFDEKGKPADEISTGRRASKFIRELLLSIDAQNRMI